MPGGMPIPIGPFKGGMNNVAELATIASDELSLAINMEFDTDGSMKSRPAITAEQTSSPQTGLIQMLGWYVRSDGSTFLVFTTPTDTRIYDIVLKTVTVIWSSVASSFTQYDNKIVMVSTATAGGYWEGGVFTACSTFPLAQQIVFYQERFWCFGVKGTSNATTLWFSNLNVISPPSSIYTFDTTNNFIVISRGDGQWITGLLADANALIIFRNSSTWQFSYPTAPSSGTLRVLSKTIGAENQWSYATYQNFYVVMSGPFLYQFINYKYYPVNTKKIKFARGILTNGYTVDIRLSIFGGRAILWYYGATYVYNLVTNTWTTWDSPTTHTAHFMQVPSSSLQGTSQVALATTGENFATPQRIWRIEEDPLNTGTGETINCMIRTKAYDIGPLTGQRRVIVSEMPSKFKRRMYWAVEARSATGVQGIEIPLIVPQGGVTWNDMCSYTWNQLSLGTWNNPFIAQVVYSDSASFPSAGPVLTVTKLAARNRALRTYYEIYMTCDGTARTSPARIYSITAYMIAHAAVSAKVS